MARPFDGEVYDRAVFDCEEASGRRLGKDYKENRYVLARPGGRAPTK